MLSIDEALNKILAVAEPLPAERIPLADALDRTLAEDIAADADSPPCDKSVVDGYAVRAADFNGRPLSDDAAPIEMAVLEEITAGMVPTVRVSAGQASRIMTGAPLPDGADAVVMVEKTHWQQEAGVRGGVVRFNDSEVRAGQNIRTKASSFRRGQVVLASGAVLRPGAIGLLSEVGCRDVRVVARPRVAILSTGNELVDASLTPAAGQIRNTNGPTLRATVHRAGGLPLDLGIARDDPQQLKERIAEGLNADVLLISGGVSAGVLDLVPGVLGELSVREVFHKVAVKPGRPLWFGHQQRESSTTLVFGLPGNPLSGLLCFELFVAPALRVLAGREPVGAATIRAVLAEEFEHRGPRTAYYPARLRADGPRVIVESVLWRGSGDLSAVANANAWAIFPAGDRHFAAGEEVECLPM